MRYKIIPVTPFAQNCTVIWCEDTKKAAIVDPGGEAERIIDTITDLGITVDKILLTHGHLDHVGAAETLARHYHVPILGPSEADRMWLSTLPDQARQFGLPMCVSFEPDTWLNEGDTIQIGNETLSVLYCPGHTPGHVVFVHHPSKLALVGDVLFKESIGRTDFPMGSYADLMHSIKQKLFCLDDETTFIPGHGPISTIGHERHHNPYIRK